MRGTEGDERDRGRDERDRGRDERDRGRDERDRGRGGEKQVRDVLICWQKLSRMNICSSQNKR